MSTTTTSTRSRLTFVHRQSSRGEIRPTAGGRPSISAAGLDRRRWVTRLQRALNAARFVVHYQPIVSLRDGRISHHEALVRLADEPDGRLVAPGIFLPAAERYGLVVRIDRMVLSRVLGLMASHGASQELAVDGSRTSSLGRPRGLRALNGGPRAVAGAPARVAVNLSAVSVTDEGMLGHIQSELARHRIDPSRLIIEITETGAIWDMPRARTFCEGLDDLGCTLALDDFGVGFGSLKYIKHLPFHYLKIDGDFIRTLPGSHRDQIVVRALVGLARSMGKETIAEYVDGEPTMRILRAYGVDHAQGFGVGRPREARDAFASAT